MSPEGEFRGVPIFHSQLLPDKMVLSVDRERSGILEVKADFDIWVLKIQGQQDRESIRKALPDLTNADLDEKVRVLCYEIVKATIVDTEPCAAFQIIATIVRSDWRNIKGFALRRVHEFEPRPFYNIIHELRAENPRLPKQLKPDPRGAQECYTSTILSLNPL